MTYGTGPELTPDDRAALEAYLDTPEAAALLEEVRPSMPSIKARSAGLTPEERLKLEQQGEAIGNAMRRAADGFAAFSRGLEAAGFVPVEEPEPEPGEDIEVRRAAVMLVGAFLLGAAFGFLFGFAL